ncbi:MAG: hypothetical protein ABIX28_06835 [Vicinamibacterales bacterium]
MKIVAIATLVAGAATASGLSGPALVAAPAADTVYVAELTPLNVKASGLTAGGTMRFTVHGDALAIAITVTGVPPTIEHWQHVHGFADGRQAACPQPSADVNGDGYIDILETEPVMGVTMVPFNDDPVAMNIPTHTYPHASAAGAFGYQKTVSLPALQAAFGKTFGGRLDLERRVVQVHGVVDRPALPGSVASLGPIPSQVTIPLACGAIRRLPSTTTPAAAR